MSNVKIALDIMGGDNGPHVLLSAADQALQTFPNLSLIICGSQTVHNHYIATLGEYDKSRVSFLVCEEVVEMTDKPTTALRKKKASSMRKAINLVAENEADACVSSGNTGALMAIAYYVLKTLPGVSRPALISWLPKIEGKKVLLLDLGASVNCDAEGLFQYAVMGSVFAEQCNGIKAPKVALLNVGEEDIKGNTLVKHADQLLQDSQGTNYIGYVEGDQIFSGKADVVVTDGFTGNIALKSSEGIAKLVIHELKRLTTETFAARIFSKLALPFLKKLYRRMNPDQYNGASLIGLRGIVVKSHGNASAEASFYAIKQAYEEAENAVPDKIKTKIESVLMEH
ncbi:phosphate acyltransferase PlsX [Glaciecola sp. MH2013]|uniref:phosphate acyltransferase PlsX n=1 Tax=Glaciecola sp. MH2013 TaxID=2785524 RepID=UPI00189D2054|nr:phosphate acyltransferase PlsX [Glaciecola sp. MH2013]MBF7072916.1 phosphate acyltransferase PlsX [Glaciecola sp. MH2013]